MFVGHFSDSRFDQGEAGGQESAVHVTLSEEKNVGSGEKGPHKLEVQRPHSRPSPRFRSGWEAKVILGVGSPATQFRFQDQGPSLLS